MIREEQESIILEKYSMEMFTLDNINKQEVTMVDVKREGKLQGYLHYKGYVAARAIPLEYIISEFESYTLTINGEIFEVS